MAIHSTILAWRIPWTEVPGGLQSMGSQSWTRLSDEAQLHCQGSFRRLFFHPSSIRPLSINHPFLHGSCTHSSLHLSIISPSTLPPLILHPPLCLLAIHPQPPSVPLSGHHLCIPASIYSSIHPSSTIHPLHPFTFIYSSTTTRPSLHPPSLYPSLHPPTLHPPTIPHQFLNVRGTVHRPGCWSEAGNNTAVSTENQGPQAAAVPRSPAGLVGTIRFGHWGGSEPEEDVLKVGDGHKNKASPPGVVQGALHVWGPTMHPRKAWGAPSWQ